MKPDLTTATSVVARETSAIVSVFARVSYQYPRQTIMTKGKTLEKQEALFTDNTGTIRIVLTKGN